jgi:hypothetical protein
MDRSNNDRSNANNFNISNVSFDSSIDFSQNEDSSIAAPNQAIMQSYIPYSSDAFAPQIGEYQNASNQHTYFPPQSGYANTAPCPSHLAPIPALDHTLAANATFGGTSHQSPGVSVPPINYSPTLITIHTPNGTRRLTSEQMHQATMNTLRRHEAHLKWLKGEHDSVVSRNKDIEDYLDTVKQDYGTAKLEVEKLSSRVQELERLVSQTTNVGDHVPSHQNNIARTRNTIEEPSLQDPITISQIPTPSQSQSGSSTSQQEENEATAPRIESAFADSGKSIQNAIIVDGNDDDDDDNANGHEADIEPIVSVANPSSREDDSELQQRRNDPNSIHQQQWQQGGYSGGKLQAFSGKTPTNVYLPNNAAEPSSQKRNYDSIVAEDEDQSAESSSYSKRARIGDTGRPPCSLALPSLSQPAPAPQMKAVSSKATPSKAQKQPAKRGRKSNAQKQREREEAEVLRNQQEKQNTEGWQEVDAAELDAAMEAELCQPELVSPAGQEVDEAALAQALLAELGRTEPQAPVHEQAEPQAPVWDEEALRSGQLVPLANGNGGKEEEEEEEEVDELTIVDPDKEEAPRGREAERQRAWDQEYEAFQRQMAREMESDSEEE